MVEVKELAIIFKRKVTAPGVEEYIPWKIVEGYFDEAESWFVDKNENIYHHITEYMSSGNCYGSRKEISKLIGKITTDGYTLIPVEVYLKDGLCKVKIALAKGKKNYDKRNDLKEKAISKEIRKVEKYR